jgi:hypothetical protein
MKIERGPYETKRAAMALRGRLFRHEGRLYRAESVSAASNPSFDDKWWATIEARPATEAEEKAAHIAELEAELHRRLQSWSDDPLDQFAAENRAECGRLKAELAVLRKQD